MTKSFLKILILFTIILGASFSALSVCAENNGSNGTGVFMEGLEDFPLMEGLVQLKDESLSFDSEKGRIVEVYADSQKKNQNQIIEFYKETLPQLGWKQSNKSALKYEREGEILNIEFSSSKPPLVVKFSAQD